MLKNIRTYLLLFLMIVTPVGDHSSSYAQEPEEQIQKLKAAFLFNFLRYAEIPGGESSSLHLCITGSNAKLLASSLNEIAGRVIEGKTIVIKRFETLPSKAHCDLHYYEQAQGGGAPTETTALTVSSAPIPAIIQFITIDDTLQFSVNLQQAKAKGIYLSSQLLRVAHHVQ